MTWTDRPTPPSATWKPGPRRGEGDDPLRVLLVNGNYRDGTQGGTQTFTQNLAAWLSAQGHTVGVLCQGDTDEEERDGDVRVYRLRPFRLPTSGELAPVHAINQTLAIHNPGVQRQVTRVLDAFRPDVCHVQMLRRLTPAALTCMLNRARMATVQTVHELFSLWNFNAFQRADTPGKLYTRPPRVVKALKACHRRLSDRVTHVCAPSRTALDAYHRDGYFRGVPATLLPNAVPFQWGDPIRAAEARRGRRRPTTSFVFLGRLDHHKGVQHIQAAMDHLGDLDVELHIAGAGVLGPSVARWAAGDPRVAFHGPLEEEGRRALLAGCDVLLCPSTWMETFGLVVLEAFASGMPAVVSRVGALPDLVSDQANGLVLEANTPSGLADAMRLMTQRGRRLRMGERAARTALRHRPERFARAQVDVYRRALATVRARPGRPYRLRPTTVIS